MGKKKKKKNKKKDSFSNAFYSFDRYLDRKNEENWKPVMDDLESYIRVCEKAEKKFQKKRDKELKKIKAKGGNVNVAKIKLRMSKAEKKREKICNGIEDGDFLDTIVELINKGAVVLKVIGKLVALLLTILLSSEWVRTKLTSKTMKRMKSVYEFLTPKSD